MKIHKEGYTTITVVFVLLAILNIPLCFLAGKLLVIRVLLAVVSVAVFVFIGHFFRSPSRIPTISENTIIAPADGEVVVIEETTENEYFNDKRIQVSIFMSPLNVHINWYPLSGLVRYFKYHKGSFLVAWHPKSSTQNERTTVVIEKENSVSVLVRQIAGAVARRIVTYAKEGEKIKQCRQMGFIKFGSRVDLFLPLDAEIKVNLKEHVKGCQTIIAHLKNV